MTLVVCKPFSDCASCFVAKIWAVKVVVNLRFCEVVEKRRKWVVLRPISRGADAAKFGHAFSNRIHFRTRGRFWLSFVRSVSSEGSGEKRKKAGRIAVKPMSVDDYVGRPNELLTYRKSVLGLPRSMSWKRPVVDVRTSLVQCSAICCCCNAAEWRHHSDDWSAASPMT